MYKCDSTMNIAMGIYANIFIGFTLEKKNADLHLSKCEQSFEDLGTELSRAESIHPKQC